MAAQAAHADALADGPSDLGAGTEGGDAPDDFMAWDTGPLQRGIVDVGGVGAADAASFDAQQHFSGPGLRREPLHQFKLAGRGTLDRAIGGNGSLHQAEVPGRGEGDALPGRRSNHWTPLAAASTAPAR